MKMLFHINRQPSNILLLNENYKMTERLYDGQWASPSSYVSHFKVPITITQILEI